MVRFLIVDYLRLFPKIKINVKDKVIDFKNNIKEKIEKK